VANLAQQIVSGLASGGIYALLALAIVIIHRSTGVINFAQGELATLSAFICFALMNHGWAFWPAFFVTLALSFGGGMVLHTVVIRPIQGGPFAGRTLTKICDVRSLAVGAWSQAAVNLPEPSTATAGWLLPAIKPMST